MRSVELALDLALIVMENGGSTTLADRTFRNVLKGLETCEIRTVWWRLDMVTVSGQEEGRPFTVLRPIGPAGVNLVRVSEAGVLAQRVAEGMVGLDGMAAEIRRIRDLPLPYGLWAMMAAAGFTSAFISQLLGRGVGAIGITFVAAAAGQFVRHLLRARKVPVAPAILTAAVISAGLAAIGLRLGLSRAVPATLIASVFYMVPGLQLINGFADAISHKHLLVGMERVAQAVYVFTILAVAVALAYAFVM